jgi:DNA-binding NtrC family response regulator
MKQRPRVLLSRRCFRCPGIPRREEFDILARASSITGIPSTGGRGVRSFLVISKHKSAYRAIRACFEPSWQGAEAQGAAPALEILRRKRFDFVFVDVDILKGQDPGKEYDVAIQAYRDVYPTLEIIVMAEQERIREAVMAVKAGASDYLTYPLNPDEVKHVTETVRKSILFQSELDYLRGQFWDSDSLELVQTRCERMKSVYEKVRSVAPTRSTVLLVGETGTGKGVLAQLIHAHSNRKDKPFISIHCGAIPDTLVESELFGHEKGAFTGASRRKLGKFEIAHGGTVFLDEIGTVTPAAQAKLLQVLQDGSLQRVGGEETIQVNVRVIAATNADLSRMCEEGAFRKDLFFRLNVFPVEIPSLRERREDIPHLAAVLLKKLKTLHGKALLSLHPQVMEAFYGYSWPGNIREMENLLERACILERSPVLTPEAFPMELFDREKPSGVPVIDVSLPLREMRRRHAEDTEKRYLHEQLALNAGKIRETARAAGISERQLHKLMRKYGLRKEDFKANRTLRPPGSA